jgi:diguanylate cyclase (GGDEF)-like protein
MGLDSCILITAPPRHFKMIVACITHGAYDTILTPVREEWAEITVTRAIERRRYYAGALMKDHYRRLSIFDELTRIHNHRYFHQALSRGISAALRYGYPFSVLLIDIDNFKAYNDRHGHHAGDEALRVMGAFLAKSIRAGDIAARYGGEEFALILTHTEKPGALTVAERLRSGMEGIHLARTRQRLPAPLTISVGAATFPEDGRTKDALILKADRALYRAKRAGKNRVCG